MKTFGIVGFKNTGKTGLMERLVTEFVSRGLSVSTIKHAHHTVDVDHQGKDSYRHRAAGASQVMLASQNRWALMTELRDTAEPSLNDLIRRMDPVDLLLVEGYKSGAHAKIETHRTAASAQLLAPHDPTIVAIAADCDVDVSQPVLDLNETKQIADFISKHLSL